MTDLISRLSAGRFPGDNAEVLKALGWYPNLCDGKPTGEWCNDDGYWGWPDKRPLPVPLDSLDDGLRLVPEGWRTCNVAEDIDRSEWHWMLSRHSPTSYQGGSAPTAAHALVLAILRAKEADRG